MRQIFKISLILLLFPMLNVSAADFKIAANVVKDSTSLSQWYLDKINAKDAWVALPSQKKVVVAILDTGIDMSHPDIAPNIWVNMDELDGDKIDNDGNGYIDDINGWDFTISKPDPRPKFDFGYSPDAVNHGTFVAGIIAALHNKLYVDGAAINVKIMPLRALNSYGFGDSYPVAEAINYAVDNGADVINMSFGGVVHSQALKSAVLRAYEAGVVIVAAAGNNETGGVDIEKTNVYPICYDKEWEQNAIIGVSAL
ncbi:MAG: S8 family serine peptidase, partial [Candidatus Falkowbacteria bacterium]